MANQSAIKEVHGPDLSFPFTRKKKIKKILYASYVGKM